MLAAIGAVIVVPLLLMFMGMSTPAERLLSIVRWPVLLIVVILGLAALYRYGPSRRSAKWRWVTWGSTVAAVLWILTSMLFSWYVASFESYNRLYGSLGAGIRLHGLDLAFCRCHPDRSRAQRRDGAPNCAGHDGRSRETSRHARCSHGRPRRSSSKLEASRHPQIKRDLGPLSGPSLNRTDVDTDPAPPVP